MGCGASAKVQPKDSHALLPADDSNVNLAIDVPRAATNSQPASSSSGGSVDTPAGSQATTHLMLRIDANQCDNTDISSSSSVLALSDLGGQKSEDKLQSLSKAPPSRAPQHVPELPHGYIVRSSIHGSIKKKLLQNMGPDRAVAPVLMIHGMGGSGKTVVASALFHDKELKASFSKFAFVPVGQNPDVRQMQRSVHLQLSGKALDPQFADNAAVMHVLREVAIGMDVLICIDDAWDMEQVNALSFLDPRTASRLLVTTRIQRLVPGAIEFMLGVLDCDDAVALMLEVAGVAGKPPFEPLAYKVAEACGRLPLVLSVAGSMLEHYGGVITRRFLSVLQEDHMEALREGDFGDEHVIIEDRIITASLKSLQGADREPIQALFHLFAIFPEDVRVPAEVFDFFAYSVFGALGKHGDVKIRSWLTVLVRLSLLQGSIANGLHQHDIIRSYCISRCSDLCKKQWEFVKAVLMTQPAGGVWPREAQCVFGSVEHYVACHLWWHIRGALNNMNENKESEEFIQQLVSSNPAVQEACAIGLGSKLLLARADMHEKDGKPVSAALLCFAVSMLGSSGRISQMEELGLLVRAQALVESVDDTKANAIERQVIARLLYLGMSSGDSDNQHLNERQSELSMRKQKLEGDSLDAAVQDSFFLLARGVLALNIFGGAANGETVSSTGIEEAANLFVSCIRRAMEGAKFVPSTNSDKKRAVILSAAHVLGPVWGTCSNEFRRSGILKDLGLPGAWIQNIRDYDFNTNGKLFRENAVGLDHFLIGGEITPTLLFYGCISSANDHIIKIASAFESIANSNKSTLCLLEERGHLMLNHAVLPMLGMRKSCQRLFRAMGLHMWSADAFNVTSSGFGSWIAAFGGTQNLLLYHKLLTFLVFGIGVVSKQEIQDLVEQQTEVKAASDYFVHGAGFSSTPMEAAGRAAELLGDDLLADWYAARAADFALSKSTVHCSMLALRGRIASRRNDRAASVGFWQAASCHAIQNNVPLMAWKAGRECGGQEGDSIIHEACSVMGRSPEDVLREFLDACAEEPDSECAAIEHPEIPTQNRVASLMPEDSCVKKLKACVLLQDSVDDDIAILTFNCTKGKYEFMPPSVHERARATVETLRLVQQELVAKGGLDGAERLTLKRFLDDRVRPFLQFYIEKARDSDQASLMRELAWRMGGRFRNIYLDTLQKTKDDDPFGDKAFANMADVLCQHCKDVELRGANLKQETTNVVELFHHALKPHEMLHVFSDEIATSCGGRVARSHGTRIALKHFWRAMEKAAFEPNPERQWEANRILDVARDGIEFSDYGSMQSAISAICNSELVEVVRIKDRISSVERATPLGWTDIVINLCFRTDVNRHVCELQLFHETSMKCRSVLGGHSDYVRYRTIAELFDANGMSMNI